MQHRFDCKARREFQIIRDYYVSNDNLQGIYFLLYDELNNTLITRFLKKELINNQFDWKQKGFFKKKYYTVGVEKGKGKENKLIIETGNLTIYSKNAFGDRTEKNGDAERMIFYLAPSVYKPF